MKKAFVTLVRKSHPNYIAAFIRFLFEVPVKVHKFVFSYLVQDGKYEEINNFLETVKNKTKDYPEIFLWIAKTYLSGSWNYDWIQLSEEDIILRIFRLLKPLAKIEEKGTRLKNMANDILFSGNMDALLRVIEKADEEIVRKLYALYKEVPYISDIEKDKFFDLIQSKRKIEWDTFSKEEEFEDPILTLPPGTILVTRKGFNMKRDMFDHLVNVEMVQNSRDIGEAQEKGDLRENAEYKAAMERQAYLQAEIKKLETELKNARVVNLDEVTTSYVTFGCTVRLKNLDTEEILTYSILGPWDSDTKKNIINYQSPLGKALLGKKVGDTAQISYGDNQTNFQVLEIERYKETVEELENV
ncbi:MAG: transcription elongation factor GreA [Leptospiraceae bacterium]|nr:transcription elongation factor GreA [Leptospiraceae bacterium]